MADKPVKRGRGRPSLTGKAGERFHIRLPQSLADDLKAAGGGSLSRGIIRQAQGEPPLRTPAQGRASKRARAAAAKP